MDDAAEHLSSISDAGGISFTQEGERRYSRGVSEMGNEFSEILMQPVLRHCYCRELGRVGWIALPGEAKPTLLEVAQGFQSCLVLEPTEASR